MTDTRETAGETFVIFGLYYWGKGSTLAEAKKAFTEQGGVLSNGYTILTFDADTKFGGVDGMGRYYFERRDGKDETPNQPTEQIVKPRGRK